LLTAQNVKKLLWTALDCKPHLNIGYLRLGDTFEFINHGNNAQTTTTALCSSWSVLRRMCMWCWTNMGSSSSCIWRFPSEMHNLFIAEKRAQSRHMNHSTWAIVRHWHVNTIQQRDTARNCTKGSCNFWATAGVSSIGPWAEC